jgi:hypothetical protein
VVVLLRSTTATEEYDGTSWTAGGTLTTARQVLAGSRNTNSSFSFWWTLLRSFTNATEEYNGTTWTAGGILNTARTALAGAGTQTAALAFGGVPPALQQQLNYMMEHLGQTILRCLLLDLI